MSLPAKLLTRQILLPLLLGFKFKVATLIPLVFGFLAILAKKALILSKIALVISSSIALGSLLFGSVGAWGIPFHGYGHSYGHGYGHSTGHGYGFNPQYGYKVADNHADYSSGELITRDKTYIGTNEYPRDQVRFQQDIYENRNTPEQGRNFAWNDGEKGAKA